MSTEAIGAPAPAVAMDVGPTADTSKPAGLHSPPDSNKAMDVDGSDSELSDLDELAGKLDGALKDEPRDEPKEESEPGPEPPVDDIGEILPDHWSGTVPVFKPTMKQFQDFKLFMEKVDEYGMKSGIIKIIAPQEWKDSLPPVDDLIKQIRVREPIKQDIMGSNGTYRQVNILHQRSYNLPQWRQLCDQSEHQPPARRGERRANSGRKPAARTRAAADPAARSAAKSSPAKKRTGGRATRRSTRSAKEEPEESEDRPMTPVSPAPEKEEVMKSVEEEPDVKEENIEEEEEPRTARRMGSSRQSKPKTQTVSARRKYIRREGSAAIDEAAFKDWDYRMDISDFTPERCEELERIYWKTLTYAPPLYGADLPGTLFDDSVKLWNLNKLPNLLDVLGTKVPGVNTAYLYLGMWKATFAWHLEDVDLYSINYLHFGAPKQWYSISQADARRFEAAMKNIWPTEAKACDQFLRHKGFLISPSHLKQHYNITVNKCVSYPGEFVVTYPYGYHSGYNLGYNCAEAVNFALDSWLPMGKVAKKCQCAQAQDSVWVDVYEIERKLRGEETEYEETEEEDDEDDDDDQETGLPSPPSSHTVRVKMPGRKRKRGSDEKEPRLKKKKIRLRLKSHVEPPCCLCPNDIPGAEIMPTDDGRKAHRMCALYLPETYIETVDDVEIVANVGAIDKARLELKCLYCRSKKGACFQCSQKKCPRSYHATCAAAAGVFVEEGEVPVFAEDGTEYKEQAFEFSCRFHRTKRDRKLDGDALENNPEIRAAAKALRKNDICQLQYYRGEIFAGVVVENRPDEEMFLLDIIPNGERVEVEWKWLLLPDPADIRLPKASANAIPMPTCRRAQKEINAKRAIDEAPRKDDEFVPGFTWAEFHGGDATRNKEQVKIDFTKENQLWYYLGKPSTEAKAQYTEDPSRPWHNPKGNFLDTLPKPAPSVRMAVPPHPRPLVAGAYPGYQTVPGAPQGANPPKQAKPYVYKPRKPIAPNPGQQQHSTMYTSHSFALNTASPSPSPQQFQQFQPMHQAVPPRPQPQPAFQHGFHQQQPQQVQQPHHGLAVNQYQPHAPDTGRKNSSAPYPSDRFPPVGGSNGFPMLPGLTWPPAHMKSGQSVQPQSRNWPSAAGAGATAPHPAPMTSSALTPPSAGMPRAGAGGQPQMYAYQKYSFFQVHHNRDSSRYRTPYGKWGGFTNGYEGNLREFLIKAQKALSGGANKNAIKHVPASLLQPLRSRLEVSHAPPHSAPASAYAPILPRPPPHASSPSASPHIPATTPSSSPVVYHNSYARQTTPGGQPGSRPQHGIPHPQHASQQNHHVWQAASQPHGSAPSQPTPSPAQAKPPLAKQSHSPIPLPPYVRQMAAAPPSAANPSPPGGTHQQAASPAGQSAHGAPTSAQPHAGSTTAPVPAPVLQTTQIPAQQNQWTQPGPAAANSTVPPQGTAQTTGPPAPSGPTQPWPNRQAWSPAPQGQQAAPPGPPGPGGHDNSELVQKMMMNLRRASQNLGTVEQGQGMAAPGDTAQGPAQS